MKYDPEKHHRRSIRLRGYDYSRAGVYFVTICTQDRICMFGHVEHGQMRLNDAGCMVAAEWDALAARFPTVASDTFVVMPNHVHGIIVIAPHDPVGAGLVPAHDNVPAHDEINRATTRVAPTVGDIIGAFKSLSTVNYTHGVKTQRWPAFACRLWQRNYYEHIIRNEESLTRAQEYIMENPIRWEFDRVNPNRIADGQSPGDIESWAV